MNDTELLPDGGMICTACDWSMSTGDGYTKYEIGKQAIEHHGQTGHRIDADSLYEDSV